MILAPRSLATRTAGFTLVEIIVAAGIFFIVATIVAGAYVSLIGLEHRARAEGNLFTDLSFALESMARDIRTGTAYACIGGNAGVCHQFSFRSTTQDATVSYLVDEDGTIGKCVGDTPCNERIAVPITMPGIVVPADGLTFYVQSATGGSPTVTITLTGTGTDGYGTMHAFTIETSATERNP